MNIALVLPHLYFLPDISKQSIFAPGMLFKELAIGLADKGHQITVFSLDSINHKGITNIRGDISYLENEMNKTKLSILDIQRTHPRTYYNGYKAFQKDLMEKVITYSVKDKFDIIHVFSINFREILSLPDKVSMPVVYTNHDPYDISRPLKKAFLEHKKNNYISISNSQRDKVSALNYISTVYNGINPKEFEYNAKPGDYFACIGRIIYPKGVHRAIEAAKRAKVKLRIAGKYYSEFGDKYFAEYVKPHIDNKQIIYEGFIKNSKARSDFLKNAKALLFPINWPEPFGLVMTEALACGTPVIAFNKGAVPEIVKDGINGYIVEGKDEMASAIKKIDLIDRRVCRDSFMNSFTSKSMVNGYEKTYDDLIKKKLRP